MRIIKISKINRWLEKEDKDKTAKKLNLKKFKLGNLIEENEVFVDEEVPKFFLGIRIELMFYWITVVVSIVKLVRLFNGYGPLSFKLIPMLERSRIDTSWLTFELSDSEGLRERSDEFTSVKEVRIGDQHCSTELGVPNANRVALPSVSLMVSPMYNSYHNPTLEGFVNGFLEKKGRTFFGEQPFVIGLKPQQSLLFDSIPLSLEAFNFEGVEGVLDDTPVTQNLVHENIHDKEIMNVSADQKVTSILRPCLDWNWDAVAFLLTLISASESEKRSNQSSGNGKKRSKEESGFGRPDDDEGDVPEDADDVSEDEGDVPEDEDDVPEDADDVSEDEDDVPEDEDDMSKDTLDPWKKMAFRKGFFSLEIEDEFANYDEEYEDPYAEDSYDEEIEGYDNSGNGALPYYDSGNGYCRIINGYPYNGSTAEKSGNEKEDSSKPKSDEKEDSSKPKSDEKEDGSKPKGDEKEDGIKDAVDQMEDSDDEMEDSEEQTLEDEDLDEIPEPRFKKEREDLLDYLQESADEMDVDEEGQPLEREEKIRQLTELAIEWMEEAEENKTYNLSADPNLEIELPMSGIPIQRLREKLRLKFEPRISNAQLQILHHKAKQELHGYIDEPIADCIVKIVDKVDLVEVDSTKEQEQEEEQNPENWYYPNAHVSGKNLNNWYYYEKKITKESYFQKIQHTIERFKTIVGHWLATNQVSKDQPHDENQTFQDQIHQKDDEMEDSEEQTPKNFGSRVVFSFRDFSGKIWHPNEQFRTRKEYIKCYKQRKILKNLGSFIFLENQLLKNYRGSIFKEGFLPIYMMNYDWIVNFANKIVFPEYIREHPEAFLPKDWKTRPASRRREKARLEKTKALARKWAYNPANCIDMLEDPMQALRLKKIHLTNKADQHVQKRMIADLNNDNEVAIDLNIDWKKLTNSQYLSLKNNGIAIDLKINWKKLTDSQYSSLKNILQIFKKLTLLEQLEILNEFLFPNDFTVDEFRPRLISGYRFPDNKVCELNEIPKIGNYKYSQKHALKFFVPMGALDRLVGNFLKYKDSFFSQVKLSIVPNPKHNVFKKNICREEKAVYKKKKYKYKKKNIFFRIANKILPRSACDSGAHVADEGLFKRYKIREYFTNEPIGLNFWLIYIPIGCILIFYKILKNWYFKNGVPALRLIAKGLGGDDTSEDQELITGAVKDLGKVFGEKDETVYTNKRLIDLVGVENLKAQMYELLLFFEVKQERFLAFTIFNQSLLIFKWLLGIYKKRVREPKETEANAILLLGPPGTGKTLLIKAIAGEAQIPVLLQSGSILKSYTNKMGEAAHALEDLFRQARKHAPCLVFIDEIDSLGARRTEHIVHDFGEVPVDGIDFLGEAKPKHSNASDIEYLSRFSPKTDLTAPIYIHPVDKKKGPIGFTWVDRDDYDDLDTMKVPYTDVGRVRTEAERGVYVHNRLKIEQISALTQLLIELDGANELQDVVVVGATNRPGVLDPALLRAGRFHKVLNLDLPDFEKRIELCRFYVSEIGSQNQLPWSYLSKRLGGYSAADIATMIRTSALKAISRDKTQHTIQTIEEGIDTITTYSIPNPSLKLRTPIKYLSSQKKIRFSSNHLFSEDNFIHQLLVTNKLKKITQQEKFIGERIHQTFIPMMKRKAAFQAGRSIINLSLVDPPSSIFLTLHDRPKNFRYTMLNSKILDILKKFSLRYELEEKLVSFLAGRSADAFACCSSLCAAIYGLAKMDPFNPSTLGEEDLVDANLLSLVMVDRFYLYAKKVCILHYHPILSNESRPELTYTGLKQAEALDRFYRKQIDYESHLDFPNQKWGYRLYASRKAHKKNLVFDYHFQHWFRILMSVEREIEINLEWRPADVYSALGSTRLLDGFILWDSFINMASEYLYRSLLFNGINYGFSLLNQKRQLLDYLIDFLLRNGKGRDPEIETLMITFLKIDNLKSLKRIRKPFHYFSKDPSSRIRLANSWGSKTRRNKDRFMNLEKLLNKDKVTKQVEVISEQENKISESESE